MAYITHCPGCNSYVTRSGLCTECKARGYEEINMKSRTLEDRVRDLEAEVKFLKEQGFEKTF